MKKALIVLTTFLLLSTQLFARQTRSTRKQTERNFRVKFHPFGVLFQRYGGAADVKINKKIAFGAEGYYSEGRVLIEDMDTSNSARFLGAPKGWGAGANVTFALGHEIFQSGPTFKLSGMFHKNNDLIFAHMPKGNGGSELKFLSPKYYSAEGIFAYEWIWQGGFNMNLGIGLAYDSSYLMSPISPSAEWSFGFAV